MLNPPKILLLIEILIPTHIYLTVLPYAIVVYTNLPYYFDPGNPCSIITIDQPFNSVITFPCIIILSTHHGCKSQRKLCTINHTNTINETMYLSDSSIDVSMLLIVWPLDNLIGMLQNSITSLHCIVIYRTF